ncbi:MAG TPA: hypothetical protein VNN73_07250 [Blastocatellia bacterium]|nr:hypothetical protein [Blastocatellia bacterium]
MKSRKSKTRAKKRRGERLMRGWRNACVKLLTTGALILIVAFTASAAYQQPPIRVRASELDRMPLIVGSLKITLTQFRGSFLKVGSGSVEAQVENTATGFATFSPQKLSFVGSDNTQADVLAIQSGDQYWPAADRSIAPGARIKEFYALTDKVHLPARLYYDEKLIAVIVE